MRTSEKQRVSAGPDNCRTSVGTSSVTARWPSRGT